MVSLQIKQHCKSARLYIALLLVTGLVACGFEDDGKINDRAPENGLYIEVELSQHSGLDIVMAVTSIFQDGKPRQLVGGDVVKVSQGSAYTLLTNRHAGLQGYSNQLAVLADNAGQPFHVEIVHEPIETREDRWYPSDIIYTDTGPGDLVGLNTEITLPEPLTLTNANTEDSPQLFSSNLPDIDIQWAAGSNAETIYLRALVDCNDGVKTHRYLSEHELGGDDGFESIALSDIIYDLADEYPLLHLAKDLAKVLLQDTLNQLSKGNIGANYIQALSPLNPIASDCDIHAYVYRWAQTDIDNDIGKARIVGSTSDVTHWRYVGANND